VSVPPEHRELYDAFARGPARLREAVSGLDLGSISSRGSEPWSIRDIIHHLTDAELVRATRIRFIVAEERPCLPAWDQEAWQRRLQYLWRSPEASLATFELVRHTTAELLGHADRTAWSRAGLVNGTDEVTVAELVQRGRDHVEEHAAQVLAMRGARGRR
jgi:hypothetical protein